MKIGLLSDTHGFLDPKVQDYFSACDEIWHAGDFGSYAIAAELSAWKTLRGVYGNVDGSDVRKHYPLDLRWQCEGLSIWMTHIAGSPNRYNKRIQTRLRTNPPNILIGGHSHILQISRDPKLRNMWFFNPGAMGFEGYHLVRTALRFEIEKAEVRNMEAIHFGPKERPVSKEKLPPEK